MAMRLNHRQQWITLAKWIFLVGLCLSVNGQQTEFDRAFERFIRTNKYRGGAVAAMKDGRLLYTQGYGVDRAGKKVTSHSRFHVSSVAKSITGVAVLQLVQRGKLRLEDKVFGRDGLLNYIVPWNGQTVDKRLYSMTVDHLLRHSSGWDSDAPPLYDPLLNKVYQDRGLNVPSMAHDLGVPFTELDPEQIISYAISHPLSFTPGTSVAYSNMAYLVLGRVIEAASGVEYRDFVKRYILEPCGMWSTRLEVAAPQGEEDADDSTAYDPSMYDELNPVYIDSALGWYSNVYDMVRFSRCTFETSQLLNDEHLELLLKKLESPPIQHNDTWYGAGFRTSTRNIVWQDADQHADDLIIYHDLSPIDLSSRAKKYKPYGKDLPDSWVILLYDKSINHIRHHSKELMANLDTQLPTENLFLYDLSDLHRHPMWEGPSSVWWSESKDGLLGTPEYTIRYQLDEHHLTAYIDALQDEGFDLHWFTSYAVGKHTYFLLVGRRIIQPIRSQYDYIFKHGMDHRDLLKKKLMLEQRGYNLTQLHSYKSRSHSSETDFAAVFRYDAFTPDTQMKYGTSHLPEPYHKLVQMYYEKKFFPISQTVVFNKKDEEFSFVFLKDLSDVRTDFKQFFDLSVKDLSAKTVKMTKENLRLSYLNSYNIGSNFKFSAIFTNATQARGMLEVDQTKERASEITISNLKDGFVPKFIAPYVEREKFKLTVYYEEQS